MGIDQLKARRERAMGKSPLFYRQPVHLVRGEGVWLYDDTGRRYMDAYNNVPCVGHCHPRVVAALHGQAATLNTHSRYLSEVVVEYCERLMTLHGDPLTVLQMCCTGTEAVEVALKMARSFTGGQGILCSNATYHGNSAEVFRMTVGPFEPDFRRVPFPEAYRPIKEGASEAELCDLYLGEIEKGIKAFAADGVPLAGMLFCSIFANEGLPDVPAGFMQQAAALVRDAGGRGDLRRGAGGVRADGPLVGLRGDGLRAGHRRDGQAHGGRPAALGRRGAPGHRRGIPPEVVLLQHHRRDAAAGGRGAVPCST